MDIWDVITKLQGKTLKTLKQGKSFDIVHVGDHEVVIKPHASGSIRHIKRDAIEDAYGELVHQRELSRAAIRTRYSDFNPAYVAAMLAQHPDVTVSSNPILLHFYGK